MDMGSRPMKQHPQAPSSQSAISASMRDLVSQIKGMGHQSTLEDHKESQQSLKPLRSLLLQNRIKDVIHVAEGLSKSDTEILVNFLDRALDHLTVSKERVRALALLSKITAASRVFPKRLVLERVRYHPKPRAAGGSATVHQGTDLSLCVKVMLRVDSDLSATWIRELVLWAHSSHPNILPFKGMFFEDVGNISQICFVSPFMKNGNLHDYAPRLVQKFRLPLIFDVINGVDYLHEWGIVHGDLKGQNVLISDEGRGMITDFGSSRIATTTTVTTAALSWTIYYAAPEVAAGGEKPSRMSDVWSFGCLCYEVLSLKPPYFQYKIGVQVVAALARKELPQRPGATKALHPERDDEPGDDAEQFSDDDEDQSEPIDDQLWSLITKCCSPEPTNRLKVPEVQELVTDMMKRSLDQQARDNQEEKKREQLEREMQERKEREMQHEKEAKARQDLEEKQRLEKEMRQREAEEQERRVLEERLRQQQEAERRRELDERQKQHEREAKERQDWEERQRREKEEMRQANLSGGTAWTPGRTTSASSYASRAIPKSTDEDDRELHERFRLEQERKLREQQAKMARGNLSVHNMLQIYADREAQWRSVSSRDSDLRWDKLPWPMFSMPPDLGAINGGAILAYLSAECYPDKRSLNKRVKDQLRRWHPNLFEPRVLRKVVAGEREQVQLGAGEVTRYLVDLLAIS